MPRKQASKQTRKIAPLRKRLATHRPLRLYSIFVSIVAVGLIVNSIWMRSGVLSYATNISPSGPLAATNQQRAANGKPALSLNSQLNQAAIAKAQDMASRNYWSHNTPEGQTPWTFVAAAGYSYQAIAENLAYGFLDSDSVVAGWMNSSGHRTNMLNETYQDVGFASADSADYQGNGNQTIVVAFYGKQTSAPAPAAPVTPAPPAPTPAPAQPAPTTAPTPAPASAEQPPTSVEAAPESLSPASPTDTQAAPTAAASETITGGAAKPITASAQNLSRFQINFGPSAIWIASLTVVSAGGMVIIFAFRHSLAWHRTLVQGEQFVLHHKALDIAIVGFVVAAAVMMQSIAAIR